MMLRTIPAPTVLLALALVLHPEHAAAQTAAQAASDAVGVENEKALQTFREGIAAFDRRDFEAARVAFLQTFALKPSAPVVRRNLGLAEIYSGHYLEGARRLGRVIHTTDEGTAVDRARMVESLRKAEAHLERVTVEVDVEGAEIRIDDVELGVSPLPFAWYLEPGTYDVRVTKPGFEPFTERRLARAGSAEHLRVHLRPIAVGEPAAPAAPEAVGAEPPAPLEVDRGPSPWLLVAGSVAAAGGLATGLALSLFASDNADKVDRIGQSLAGARCFDPPTAACRELADAADAHDSQVRWATVSFALGAAAGVSTLVYAVLASSGSGQRATDAGAPGGLGLAVGQNGGHVVFDGTF